MAGGLAARRALADAFPPSPEELAERMVARVNRDRQAQGLEPLIVNDQLTQLAQWRSDDMAAAGYISHDPPPGHPSLPDLTERLGYRYEHTPVEIVARVGINPNQKPPQVPDLAMQAWRESPDHWRQVLNPYLEMTGVGVARGEKDYIVTMLFWLPEDVGGWTPPGASEYNRETP